MPIFGSAYFHLTPMYLSREERNCAIVNSERKSMMILIQNKVVSDSKMMKLLCVFIVSHVLNSLVLTPFHHIVVKISDGRWWELKSGH